MNKDKLAVSKSVTRRLINTDITWCDFWEDCASADTCPRALTPEVKKEMDMFRVIQISHFMDKPECWKDKKENEDTL